MSEEKGAVAELEPPSTDTVAVDEVLRGVQELPDVGLPEIASEEIVVPSEKLRKKRQCSEAQLKQRENARAAKKKKKLTIENAVSLLKEDHENYKKQVTETHGQWEKRYKEQQEKTEALEKQLSEYAQRMNAAKPPAPQQEAPKPVTQPPVPARNNIPVNVRSGYSGPARSYVIF
jgi:hypothetical protein